MESKKVPIVVAPKHVATFGVYDFHYVFPVTHGLREALFLHFYFESWNVHIKNHH